MKRKYNNYPLLMSLTIEVLKWFFFLVLKKLIEGGKRRRENSPSIKALKNISIKILIFTSNFFTLISTTQDN